MLEICGLTKRFNGIPVVENVSFTLQPGEILGYVGPNGAGKSTTVKMIVGLLEPSEGQVRFQGKSVIEDLPGFQARIGYVPEEPHLYPICRDVSTCNWWGGCEGSVYRTEVFDDEKVKGSEFLRKMKAVARRNRLTYRGQVPS